MISNVCTDFTVTIPGSDTVVNNMYLWHSEEDYKLLKHIYNHKELFTSGIYAMLANTFERMYKGFAIELQKLFPNESIVPNDIECGHYITPIAQKVNRFCPIATNKDAYYVTLDNLNRIHKGYTASRYTDIYQYQDFEKDFRRLEIQRERVGKLLSAEIIKHNCKEIMEIDNNIDHNDLDLL